MYFAQRMNIEFRNDKSAITAESAAIDAGGFDNLLDAGGDHSAQLGIGRRASHTAIYMKCNRSGFASDYQSRQERIMGKLVKVHQDHTTGQILLHAYRASTGIHDDRVKSAMTVIRCFQ